MNVTKRLILYEILFTAVWPGTRGQTPSNALMEGEKTLENREGDEKDNDNLQDLHSARAHNSQSGPHVLLKEVEFLS